MRTSKKPENFIRTPHFIGGDKAMDQFVKDNLNYPEEAFKSKIGGTVSLVADIDFKGKVVKIQIKKGLGFGCDEEAKRVVGLMQFESIKLRGMRVIYHKTIQIHFKTPAATIIDPVVTYTYVEKGAQENVNTYTYKIGE